MKIWMWILIIVAVAVIAFVVGRKRAQAAGCKTCNGKGPVVEVQTPAPKTGIDQNASASPANPGGKNRVDEIIS